MAGPAGPPTTALWHGAPVDRPPGLDALWHRRWRTVLRYSTVVNLCNMFG